MFKWMKGLFSSKSKKVSQDRYIGGHLVSEDTYDAFFGHMEKGHRVNSIQVLRAGTGIGLKEAHGIVVSLENTMFSSVHL